MEKSTKSEFQTEIKPKTEEKKEDFEEHVQHGMEIVEKFLNESETQLQESETPYDGKISSPATFFTSVLGFIFKKSSSEKKRHL